MSPETRLYGLIALLANAALFAVIGLLPETQRIYAFIACIFIFALIVIATRQVLSRSKSHDHYPSLNLKVVQLREKLVDNDFLPQLIVAIPRGGLAVAGMLARQLGDERIVPVIALTPRRQPEGFDNPFNTFQFTRADIVGTANGPAKILIIDDICRSGRTLAEAKAYLEDTTHRTEFLIKTAALSFYAQGLAIAPSFFVDKLKDPIRDASGELETW